MEIVSIPSIATIVYAIVEIYKEIFKSEKAKRAIPIVAGVLGAIWGVVAFFACPSIVPTDNAFIAAVMGLFSGLSSVGVNQIGKQLFKKDGEKND